MDVSGTESKIRTAFEAITPDLKERVLQGCLSTEQVYEAENAEVALPREPKGIFKYIDSFTLRRAAGYAVFAMLAVCVFLVGLFLRDDGSPVGSTESFIYVDVNPSVVIELDSENRVVDCKAINGDAETVLSGLELRGKNMNEAISQVIDGMREKGFITVEANSVLISVQAVENVDVDALITEITVQVNETLDGHGIKGDVSCQKLKVNDELKQAAEENGISVGKMNYINKLIEEMGDVTDEEAEKLIEQFKDKPIKELSKLHSEIKQENNNGNNGNHGRPDDGEKPGEGEVPGGETPGGETPGGETPGGETPGGNDGDHELDNEEIEDVLNKTEISKEDIKQVDYQWIWSRLGFKIIITMKNGEVHNYFYSFWTGEVTEWK